MNNWYAYVNDKGMWDVTAGGYMYPTMVGPYATWHTAWQLVPEFDRRWPGHTMPHRTPKAKESAARRKWKTDSRIKREVWKRVRGVGNPFDDGAIWQRGKEVVYLEVNEGEGDYTYEISIVDLTDVDCSPKSWIRWESALESCEWAGRNYGRRGKANVVMPHSPLERLEVAADYHGWHEFDNYPDRFGSARRAWQYLDNKGIDVSEWEDETWDDPTAEDERRWREGQDMEGKYNHALLRRTKGDDYIDNVETSQSQNEYVESSRVEAAWPKVEAMIRRWHRYYLRHMVLCEKMFGYELSMIDEDGILYIGCNKVRVQEIIRLYREEFPAIDTSELERELDQ